MVKFLWVGVVVKVKIFFACGAFLLLSQSLRCACAKKSLVCVCVCTFVCLCVCLCVPVRERKRFAQTPFLTAQRETKGKLKGGWGNPKILRPAKNRGEENFREGKTYG